MTSLAQLARRRSYGNFTPELQAFAELAALVKLAGERIKELEAEEWDPRLDDAIETGSQ